MFRLPGLCNPDVANTMNGLMNSLFGNCFCNVWTKLGVSRRAQLAT